MNDRDNDPNSQPPSKLAAACVISLVLLMFLCLALTIGTPAYASERAAHQITFHMLRESDGATATTTCSSTAVGKRTLLTATHCFDMPEGVRITKISLGDKEVTVERHETDGRDHSLVVLSGAEFQHSVRYQPRALASGEDVRFWGWPAGFDRQFRRAYVSGTDQKFLTMAGYRAWLLDGQGYPGDSGSGVYDARGRLVGVVSYIHKEVSADGVRLQFVGVIEAAWTDGKLEVVR